jgi:predicted secreted protein
MPLNPPVNPAPMARQTEHPPVTAMLLRLRLLLGSLVGASLLLVALCLGAQNLSDRPRLQLGFGSTAPLPSGFLVGIALALGVVSGGSAVALLAGRSTGEDA